MRQFALAIALVFSGAQLMGQQLAIKPMLFGIHRSDGGTWTADQQPVNLLGWGVDAAGQYGAWSISAQIVFMRFFAQEKMPFPNRFTPEKGYSWSGHLTSTLKERDSNYADMRISYKTGRVEALFGKFSRSWGPGRSPLMISHKPPTYPQFGFEWQVMDNLQFSYFHGKLHSGITDSSKIFVYRGLRVPALDRYVVAHRLEWNPTRSLQVAATEMVIYGGRAVELIYLMPFILFMSAENFMQDRDNVVMGLDVAWHPWDNFRIYGAFMMDEWKPEATFAEKDHNWFGWQAGLAWQAVIGKSDWLAIEYTWTDHRVYRHRFDVNHAYSHNYPLGFWAGPHAQALEVEYGFEWRGFKIVFNLTNAKRGQVTDDMTQEKYEEIVHERFSGPTEWLQNIGLAIGREVWRRLRIEGGISSIRWENANFDPFNPTADGPKPNKTSFSLGIYYNFEVQGARHPYR